MNAYSDSNHTNTNNNDNGVENHDPDKGIVRPTVDRIVLRNKYWQTNFQKVKNTNPTNSKNSPTNNQTLHANNDVNYINEPQERNEIVAYSAFYDTREETTYVRVLAVKRKVNVDAVVWCQLWFELTEIEQPLILQSEIKTTGKDHDVAEKLVYKQQLISCPIPPHIHKVPKFVSLAFGALEDSTIYLPVQLMEGLEGRNKGEMDERMMDEKDGKQFDYGFVVCVTSTYGKINPYEIAEWLETQKLLGVSKVGIYNCSITNAPKLNKVFDYYIKDGILDLQQIYTAAETFEERYRGWAFKLVSPAVLNDCMMRYMGKAKWVGVIDMDEIIIPTTHPNLHSLFDALEVSERNKFLANELKNLEQDPDKSKNPLLMQKVEEILRKTKKNVKDSYIFSMTYFLREFKEDPQAQEIAMNEDESSKQPNQSQQTTSQESTKTTNQSQNIQHHGYKLVSDRFKWRMKICGSGIAPKSFINPRKCLSVFNHYCYIPIGNMQRHIVNPSMAKVHHYRKHCPHTSLCEGLKHNLTFDKASEKFSKLLRERLSDAFKKIF